LATSITDPPQNCADADSFASREESIEDPLPRFQRRCIQRGQGPPMLRGFSTRFDWFHQAELGCPLVETSLRRKCGSRVSTSASLVRLGNFSKLEPSGLVENPTSSLQVRAFPLKLQWPKL